MTDLGPYRTAPPKPPDPPKPKASYNKLHMGIIALWGLALLCDIPLLIWKPTLLVGVNVVMHLVCLVAWSYVVDSQKNRRGEVDCGGGGTYSPCNRDDAGVESRKARLKRVSAPRPGGNDPLRRRQAGVAERLSRQ
jgi:hypothetical protein